MEYKKLTIVKKGLLLIALPTITQLLLLGFLFYLQHDSAVAEQWTAHSRDVIAASDEAVRWLSQALGDTRGHVVTSSAVFDDSAAKDLQRSTAAIENLHALVRDNPQQLQRVEKVQRATGEYVDWSTHVRGLVRAGKHEQAVSKVTDLSGRRALSLVESALDDFRQEEERLAQLRTQAVTHARHMQQLVLVIATAGTLGIATIAVLLFSKSFSRRVAVLTDNARRLAGGEALAAPVAGSDEIAQLDQVLHASAAKLAAAAQVERQYKADIELRAAELARVNQELVQKTRENEMFVYSVSHDLRSPLVNLQGFSRELARSCGELHDLLVRANVPEPLNDQLLAVVDQDLPDSLRFIQSAVTRSANIIDAMLRLSRAGRIEYRWEDVSISQIVQRVIESAASTIAERQANIVVKDLSNAWGDSTAIEQIFGNLIINALNYLDPSRPGQIEVGMLPIGLADPSHHTYYVKDNGLGIPEAYLHKMFVAFQRLHGDIVKGEGIGLALVRRVVERHAGKIWVESREKVGSTFFVALPANEAAVRQITGNAA